MESGSPRPSHIPLEGRPQGPRPPGPARQSRAHLPGRPDDPARNRPRQRSPRRVSPAGHRILHPIRPARGRLPARQRLARLGRQRPRPQSRTHRLDRGSLEGYRHDRLSGSSRRRPLGSRLLPRADSRPHHRRRPSPPAQGHRPGQIQCPADLRAVECSPSRPSHHQRPGGRGTAHH